MRTDTVHWLKTIIWLAIFLHFFSNSNAQGWRQSFASYGGGPYQSDGVYATHVETLSDGRSLIMANYPDVHASYFFLFHAADTDQSTFSNNPYFNFENDAFHHFSRDAVLLPDSSFIVLEEKEPFDGGQRELFLTRYKIEEVPNLPTYYNFLWHKQLYANPSGESTYAHSIIATADGGFAVLASTNQAPGSTDRDVVLIKANADGDLVWSNIFPTNQHDYGAQLLPTNDGGFLVLKTIQDEVIFILKDARLMKVDANGTLQWETNLSANEYYVPFDMIRTADGNIAMTGQRLAGRDLMIMKLEEDGTEIWHQYYPASFQDSYGRAIIEDGNGNLVVAGTYIDSTFESNIYLVKITAAGEPVWENQYGLNGRDEEGHDLTLAMDGGYLVGGRAVPENGLSLGYAMKTDVNGIVKPGLIHGNVFHDFDLDCAPSAGDAPLTDWIVRAFQDSTHVFYGDTDSLGNYRIECDTGSYVLSLILPSNYWEPCANFIPLYIDYLDTAQVDFAVQAAVECPYLTVDHATSFVRPCDTTYFFVNFCNEGPVTASDAHVEISLDSLFTFLDSDIPPSSVNGNQITFPLGDIGPDACGEFRFSAFVACDATMGAIACSEAHIFPDSICSDSFANWEGAFIIANGACLGDSVHFTLQNIGDAATLQPLDYIVIEDAVLLMQGSFELGSGESLDLPNLATGATLHLIAEQEPGVPGNSIPIAAVEGCVGSSGNPPSLGFYNQFSQNDGEPHLSIFCLPVTSSFDPNDKQAFPTGFDVEHHIFENTELEYLLRFQNTGTDTAFRVVLLDTLSAFLNPATVRPGASSHPYEFEIEDNGVLRFTFRNINLPHEAVDASGSNGFVSFRIAQQPGNAVGTVIENSAAIYFDFNLPIITNTTWHTIHEPLIQIVNEAGENAGDEGGLLVYPNPSNDFAIFEMVGNSPKQATFSMYDRLGRQVRSGAMTGNRYRFDRGELTQGVYFYVIENEGEKLYSGKIILR